MQAEAIVAVDARKVEIREIDIGEVGDWDIRVELETSAISVGTESYVLSLESVREHPFVLGYAPVGRVVETGARVTSFAVDDRVSYFAPRTPEGAGQQCGGHQSPGIIDVNPQIRSLLGPDCYCVKVPEGLSSERAAYGGISAVSCRGVSMVEPQVGERVLVVGQGLIGQFAAQHFRLRGAEVAVADLYAKRLEAAPIGGADHTIDSSTQDMAGAVRGIWPGGADIVTDTTGNYAAIETALDALRWRGRVVFLGWCKGTGFNFPKMQGKVDSAHFPWTLEGQRVESSWRLMVDEALKVDHLTTHRFAFRDAQQAYDLVYDDPEGTLGILLDWR